MKYSAFLMLLFLLFPSIPLFPEKLDLRGINEKESFWLNIKDFGYYRFVPVDNFRESNEVLDLYLIDTNGNVVLKLPDHYGSGRWLYSSVYMVSSRDMNFDGYDDITVIAYFIAVNGTKTREPFTVTSVYFYTNKSFTNYGSIDGAINSNIGFQNIYKVYDFMKTIFKK